MQKNKQNNFIKKKKKLNKMQIKPVIYLKMNN